MGRNQNRNWMFTRRQVKNIMAGVSDSVKRGIHQSLEALAPEFLNATVAQNAGFNNYTGNLEEAYVAIVISNGVKKRIFYHDATAKNDIEYGPKGGRRVRLARPTRHPVLKRIKNPYRGNSPQVRAALSKMFIKDARMARYYSRIWAVIDHPMTGAFDRIIYGENGDKHYKKDIYRSVKPYETDAGYRHLAKRGAAARGGWEGRGQKGTYAARSRSSIRIINVAPYAAAVQYRRHGHRYNVIKGGMVKELGKDAAVVMKTAIMADLKRYGFRNGK